MSKQIGKKYLLFGTHRGSSNSVVILTFSNPLPQLLLICPNWHHFLKGVPGQALKCYKTREMFSFAEPCLSNE